MKQQSISQELHDELSSLPSQVLMETALLLRDQWLADPYNGAAFIGMLVAAEILGAKGLTLPPCPEEETLNCASQVLYRICSDSSLSDEGDIGYSS